MIILPIQKFLYDLDWKIFRFINEGSVLSDFLDPLMSLISAQKTWAFIAVCFLLRALFEKNKIKKRKLFWFLLFAGIGVIIVDALSYNILKDNIQRLRPCHQASVRLGPDICGGLYSMPSNHGTNAMFVAVLGTFYWGIRTGILMLLASFLVGYSRVYLGVHFPSDILIGYLFGGISAWFMYFLIAKKFV